jgi:DHA2 family methylenomycin A resistance protein-like MFS transporter
MRSASARIPSVLQSVTDARLPQVNGLSAFATGLAFVPMKGAVLPVNLIAPRVTERIGAPLTSTLLGSVAKSRSGIAAGVLNATRQTGSVLGVAMFGALVGQSSAFIAGLHASLITSAGVLLAAAAAIWWGASMKDS